MSPKPTRIVAGLPDTIPFVAPEELERQMGTTFLARLGANESVFGPSQMAVEAMQTAASQPQWYGDPLSYELRAELAHQHGLSMDHFVVGSGIDGLFSHIASAFLEPGDSVVTTLGSYPTFNYFIDAVGGTLVQVPYRDLAVDLDGLAQAAIESNAKVVYLANPDNPSGTFHSRSAIESFLGQLPEDLLILLDEAYIEFVESFDLSDPRLIRLRTFSKAYGLAGMRVAYAMGDPATIQPLNRIRPHFEVNAVAQAGALASLRDPAHLSSVREKNRQGQEKLSEILHELGYPTMPSSTNFILADAGTRVRAEHLVLELRKRRVFIRKPGLPPLDHYIRVTIGTDQDHRILKSALEEIALQA